jgi:hypothetical protein
VTASQFALDQRVIFLCLYAAGVPWDAEDGVDLVRKITASNHATFRGLYTHEGHSYTMRGTGGVVRCGEEAVDRILSLASKLIFDISFHIHILSIQVAATRSHAI